MKDWIKKIKEFVKRNYIACTVVGALVLVIIASLIIVGLIKSFKNRIETSTESDSYYQYFDVNLNSFEGTLSLENDRIVNVESDTYKIYNGSPVYSNTKDEVIIPKVSSIVFYLQDNVTFKLPKYSRLTYLDDIHFVSSNGKKESASAFFVYDGEDTYLTFEPSRLKVNGTEIYLSNYSYVIASKDSVLYYNYETKEVHKIENITSASLILDKVAIDLLKDVTVKDGQVDMLLSNINNLKVYLED